MRKGTHLTLCFILMILVGFMVTGCKRQIDTTPDTELRLTHEDVIVDGNKFWIVIFFPEYVEEPVVILSEETGNWVVAAKAKQ